MTIFFRPALHFEFDTVVLISRSGHHIMTSHKGQVFLKALFPSAENYIYKTSINVLIHTVVQKCLCQIVKGVAPQSNQVFCSKTNS